MIQLGVEAPLKRRSAVGADVDPFNSTSASICKEGVPWSLATLQTPGFGAVAAADDKDGIRFGGEGLDLRLAFLRGVADGVKDDRLGKFLPDPPNDRGELLDALRRLGDDTHLLKFGEAFDILRGAQDDPPLPGKTQKAIHFGMFPVPTMRTAYPAAACFRMIALTWATWAGGVYDPESLFLVLLPLGRELPGCG
jgi:hypothetical protein